MSSEKSSPAAPDPFRLSLRQWLFVGATFAGLAVTAIVLTKTAMATRVEIEQRIASLRSEEERLKAGIKAANDELIEKQAQLKQVNSELDAYAKRDTTRQTPTPTQDIPAGTEAPVLVSLFGGPDRRAASDKLVALYAAGQRDQVVSALLGAVVPKEAANSYRVNLYVLYTFARIGPRWEGSREQVRAVEALAGLARYYDDPTYSTWAQKAVSQARVK